MSAGEQKGEPMFHVIVPGTHTHVLTRVNPAEDGFTDAVDRDFMLSYSQDDLAAGGQKYPMRCLGRAKVAIHAQGSR
jgi:hypothetical protein